MNKDEKRKILSTDPDVFCEMIRKHGPTIRAWLSRHVWDHDTVNELAQETFVAAWSSLDHYDGTSSIAAWLTGIARNRLRNHLRSKYRRSSAMERYRDQLLTLLGGEDSQYSDSSLKVLGKCIEKLPDRSKEIVKGRYYGSQTVADLAESHSMEPNALSQLLFRIKSKLKTCIKENSDS